MMVFSVLMIVVMIMVTVHMVILTSLLFQSCFPYSIKDECAFTKSNSSSDYLVLSLLFNLKSFCNNVSWRFWVSCHRLNRIWNLISAIVNWVGQCMIDTSYPCLVKSSWFSSSNSETSWSCTHESDFFCSDFIFIKCIKALLIFSIHFSTFHRKRSNIWPFLCQDFRID